MQHACRNLRRQSSELQAKPLGPVTPLSIGRCHKEMKLVYHQRVVVAAGFIDSVKCCKASIRLFRQARYGR